MRREEEEAFVFCVISYRYMEDTKSPSLCLGCVCGAMGQDRDLYLLSMYSALWSTLVPGYIFWDDYG